MTRYRLVLSYDGTDFSGWATQPGRRTVQGELESWIAKVLRIPPVRLQVAGRTDAGVHARGQVAHLDLEPELDLDMPQVLLRRLARVLPSDLVVRQITVAPLGFDARFSALSRRYCYRLWDQPVGPDPLQARMIAKTRAGLDLPRMNQAAQSLLGLRDFAAFCKKRDQPGGRATTIRTLLELHGARTPDGMIEFTVRADAFCHSMVRSLIGGLVTVGAARQTGTWLRQIADAGARGALTVMPPHGLTLEEVRYPPDSELAARAGQARASRQAQAQPQPQSASRAAEKERERVMQEYGSALADPRSDPLGFAT